MPGSGTKTRVILELGAKRTFAVALDWPGWARSGRDERSALKALLDYAPRYGQVLVPAKIAFDMPVDLASFQVTERLPGNPTTDFGAPNVPASIDLSPIDETEIEHLKSVLSACWQAFDRSVAAARGKELRKGPRGGGRDLDEIIEHITGADGSYLSRLSWTAKLELKGDLKSQQNQVRKAIITAIDSVDRSGGLPTPGPHGGARWALRTFIRRVAWHTLDHAWEIEDRIT